MTTIKDDRPAFGCCTPSLGSEISKWIEKWSSGRVDGVRAKEAARRYLFGEMGKGILLYALQEAFPNAALCDGEKKGNKYE